jgi:hypothetical protein
MEAEAFAAYLIDLEASDLDSLLVEYEATEVADRTAHLIFHARRAMEREREAAEWADFLAAEAAEAADVAEAAAEADDEAVSADDKAASADDEAEDE